MRGEERKAVQVLHHPDGSGQQITLPGFETLSGDNSTAKFAPAQVVITPLLLHGEANALPLGELKKLTGLDRRMIRRRIQMERRAGACICVNNRDGYFLAETEAERARCVASMRRRAAEVYRTADAIERAEVKLEES